MNDYRLCASSGGPSYEKCKYFLQSPIDIPDVFQDDHCFRPFTCHQVVVKNVVHVRDLIDNAFYAAMRESKPIYIGIPFDILRRHLPESVDGQRENNKRHLKAVVEKAAAFLNKAVNSVLMGGPAT